MRNFLAFASHTDAQLDDLLIFIQPLAISAASVFLKGTMSDKEWVEEVELKIAMVNGMATELEIYDAYTRALRTTTSRSPQHAGMDYDILMNFLNSVISLLWDMLRDSKQMQDQFIDLYARLRSYRAILKQRPNTFDGEIKDQVGGLIRDAGSLIYSSHRQNHVEQDVDLISDLVQRFDIVEAIIQNAPSLNSEYSHLAYGDHSTTIEFCHGDKNDLNVCEDSQMSSHQPPKIMCAPSFVGFHDEEEQTILDQLIRGSKRLRTVLIYGMAGIGKATFALKLYNHLSIMYHFHVRAWCTISQVLDKKKILVQLLNQIDESSSYSNMTDDDLACALFRRLKGRRFLIILDDVWTLDVWNSLQLSFPDDSTQSRIIMTSRHSDIAPRGLLDREPHSLRLREDHECFEILQMRLSREEGWNIDIGIEVAKLCKGLPLVVVIVVGLLANVKQEGWKTILDHLRSGGVSREEQCNNALEMSFKHLPDELKLCFLYISAFLEDEQVSVKRLIRLWMAEGFVENYGSKTKEEVAREFIESLNQRSLVMVSQSRSIGGVKIFRIHDVVREFCMRKARQVKFFHFLNGGDGQLSDFNEPCCLQRLSIHSTRTQFKNSKLVCPHANSLLLTTPLVFEYPNSFSMSSIIQIFKLLKVLDLQEFGVIDEIPSEIEVLTRLTYLSVHHHRADIPSSIGNLSNLETNIANPALQFETTLFPDTFWNLQKLNYLYFPQQRYFSLPIENLEKWFDMLELETVCGIRFESSNGMEKLLKKFPNIRRLRCSVAFDFESEGENICKIDIPDIVNQLQSFTISGFGKLDCDFGSTQKLRKVTLKEFKLSKKQTMVIGRLPNLEVLKLINIDFSGGTLEMEDGDFSKVKIFHLHDFPKSLERWTASDEQLPSLQKMVLRECTVLKEIPSTCLEKSATLKEIEVYECSLTLDLLIRAIEVVHEDFGDYVKVTISSSDQ